MNIHKRTTPPVLIILMLTIIIEMMGFLLVFPLFPALFISSNASLVEIHTSMFARHLYYCIALSVWPIGAFFGSPYLGALSDKIGRRKVLIICLILNGLSYAIAAISINLHYLILFFLSRLLSGFFGGSYDIVQAATADISTPELKARNMGLITFAVAIGIILGPIIASFTSSPDIFHWFSITTPFWIAFCLAMFNAAGVAVLFKDTYQVKKGMSIHLITLFSEFLFIFRDRRVIKFGVVFFLLNLGWGLYMTAIPLILVQIFHFSTQFTGVFYCVLGVGCALAILFIQPMVLKRFSLKKIYFYAIIMMGIMLLAAGIFQNLKEEWITVFILGLLEILCYSSILAITSNAVTNKEQGKTMGGLGAVTSIAFLFDGFLLLWLSNIEIFLPILAAAIACFLSGILVL